MYTIHVHLYFSINITYKWWVSPFMIHKHIPKHSLEQCQFFKHLTWKVSFLIFHNSKINQFLKYILLLSCLSATTHWILVVDPITYTYILGPYATMSLVLFLVMNPKKETKKCISNAINVSTLNLWTTY